MKHAVALLLLALAFSASAHRDRLLSASADGSIAALPPKYMATRIQFEFSEGQTGKLTKLRLVSAGRTTNIKDCLMSLVPYGSRDDTQLAGSWYHDKRLLPDYMHIRFKSGTPDPKLPEEPGVVFLFSLEDARLLEVRVVVPLPNEQAVQHREIKLRDGCPA
jgi:hypothetical protein